MKKLAALGLALALGVGALSVMTPTEAEAWFCRARSNYSSATGWGRSLSLYRARSLAIWQCRRRGPGSCFIVYCR
jgi:hypothetical protein